MTDLIAAAKAELEGDKPRYLIRKYGGWYKPNSQGYTGSAILAGRYTLAEAEDITHPNGPNGHRDGMTFIHEDDLQDDDWKAYAKVIAALEAAEARIAGLTAYGDPSFYVTAKAQAERAAASTSKHNDELRDKLKAANSRANSAETRASGEQKKREAAEAENAKLRLALADMWAGWKYIRMQHGDLPGVGWDRCDEKARAALGEKP